MGVALDVIYVDPFLQEISNVAMSDNLQGSLTSLSTHKIKVSQGRLRIKTLTTKEKMK